MINIFHTHVNSCSIFSPYRPTGLIWSSSRDVHIYICMFMLGLFCSLNIKYRGTHSYKMDNCVKIADTHKVKQWALCNKALFVQSSWAFCSKAFSLRMQKAFPLLIVVVIPVRQVFNNIVIGPDISKLFEHIFWLMGIHNVVA